LEGVIVKNGNSFEDIHMFPYMIVKNDVIIEVNKQFIEMVKYKLDDFIGERIEDILNVLKMFPKVNTRSIGEKDEYFIFTKNHEVRIVTFKIIRNEDKLDMIFEQFGQVNSSLSRQAEDAGIGLSLVTKFVEAMNGTISVESKV
jgi:signal transduction histidine kinase